MLADLQLKLINTLFVAFRGQSTESCKTSDFCQRPGVHVSHIPLLPPSSPTDVTPAWKRQMGRLFGGGARTSGPFSTHWQDFWVFCPLFLLIWIHLQILQQF